MKSGCVLTMKPAAPAETAACPKLRNTLYAAMPRRPLIARTTKSRGRKHRGRRQAIHAIAKTAASAKRIAAKGKGSTSRNA